MRVIFEEEADANNRHRLLITMAVAAGKYNIDKGYEPAELSEYVHNIIYIHVYTYIYIYINLFHLSNSLFIIIFCRAVDFISIMAYDLHGAWETTTGHNAPLKSRSDETSPANTLNVVGKYILLFKI